MSAVEVDRESGAESTSAGCGVFVHDESLGAIATFTHRSQNLQGAHLVQMGGRSEEQRSAQEQTRGARVLPSIESLWFHDRIAGGNCSIGSFCMVWRRGTREQYSQTPAEGVFTLRTKKKKTLSCHLRGGVVELPSMDG